MVLVPVARGFGLQVPGTALAAALTAAAAACAPAAGDRGRVVVRSSVSMGTQVRVTAWVSDDTAAAAAIQAAFDEFDRLDGLFTVWRDSSDISRLNAAAGRRPVEVARETIEVLREARTVSGWTAGKFDVTFGALSGLWKFDHDQDGRVPDPRDVAERLPLVDYRDLDLDEAEGSALLRRRGMRAHLGGIGKGYAVDRAAALLRSRGLAHFMIEAGGDIYASGRHGDRPWRVGIRDPRGEPDRVFAAIDVAGEAVSTSGDYERAFAAGGRRYHHILDPDRGEPARGCRSVTIVAGRSVVADALSTGVFVMGPEAGMALVERLPGVEAVIVTGANAVLVSSGLRGRLSVLAALRDGT
jgi:thiamine biosynthesis lipoprotein